MKPVIILMLMLWSFRTVGATPDERAVSALLAPHAEISSTGGKDVAVHYGHITAYSYGAADRGKFANEMREMVEKCIKRMKKPAPSHSEYPGYFFLTRLDEYSAPNRRIRYGRGVTLKFPLEDDCVLRLSPVQFAILESSAGQCNIDLIRKTAFGRCDMREHETAKPKMIDKPTLLSRPRKTVVGIECLDYIVQGHALACETLGEFPNLAGNFYFGTVKLEESWKALLGYSRLENVRMNMAVNASVFAPHKARGFTITNTPKQEVDLSFLGIQAPFGGGGQ